MSDDPILAMLADQRDRLALHIAELQAELVPALADHQRLELAIAALTGNALAPEPERHLTAVPGVFKQTGVYPVSEQMAAVLSTVPRDNAIATHRRNPVVQAAIDAQSPSVAIPRGTHVECMSCIGTESHHTFPDLLALSTHTRRHHDREPTLEERTPK